MCHVSMLSSAQIEALDGLSRSHQLRFERLTDKLKARDLAGTLAAWATVMDEAGQSTKSVERIEEAAAAAAPGPVLAFR